MSERAELAGKLVVVALTAGLGLAIAAQVTSKRTERGFEEGCRSFEIGDTPERVYSTLGAEGYRPGCGESLPCSSADLGIARAVPFACEGDDCSMYWRRGGAACLVEFAPRDGGPTGPEGFTRMGVTSVSYLPLGSDEE